MRGREDSVDKKKKEETKKDNGTRIMGQTSWIWKGVTREDHRLDKKAVVGRRRR